MKCLIARIELPLFPGGEERKRIGVVSYDLDFHHHPLLNCPLSLSPSFALIRAWRILHCLHFFVFYAVNNISETRE